jgi:hypothetical protein
LRNKKNLFNNIFFLNKNDLIINKEKKNFNLIKLKKILKYKKYKQQFIYKIKNYYINYFWYLNISFEQLEMLYNFNEK